MSNTSKRKILVAINEANEIYRKGIISIIKNNKQFEFTGEFSDNAQLLDYISSHKTDVVLISAKLIESDIQNSVKEYADKHPHTAFIMMTDAEVLQDATAAFNSAARGILLRNISIDEVHNAIISVHSGEKYYSKELALKLVKLISRKDFNAAVQLDRSVPRKDRIFLQLMCQGLTAKEMSTQLGVAPRTVHIRIQTMLRKLDKKNIVQLMNYAIQSGIYNPFEQKH